jgi:hypothetical protein
MLSRHAAPTRGKLVVTNVAVPSKPPAFRNAKRSKVEIIKEKSDYLRHPLMQELVDEKPYISDEAVQLMKFHGSYMQDQREKRAFGQGKFYQFMMRTRQPSGLVTNQLYLVMDELADKVCDTDKHVDCSAVLHDASMTHKGLCWYYCCPVSISRPPDYAVCQHEPGHRVRSAGK